jgi:HK97 family phage prohead protease
MMPGVASRVLARDDLDCRFLVDHDPSRLLARTTSGTLTLEDGPDGLNMTAVLYKRDTDAANCLLRIEREDLSAMSCAFRVAEDTWSADYTQRTVRSLDCLTDISAVAYPCSPRTSISLAGVGTR